MICAASSAREIPSKAETPRPTFLARIGPSRVAIIAMIRRTLPGAAIFIFTFMTFGRALAQSPNATTTPSSYGKPAPEELAPGTEISSANADSFAKFLPEAAKAAVAHGLTMKIVPSQRIQWSQGFENATEKYSPQVKLDEQDHLENYVAGMPFPLIDTTDPKVAVKIAYNWHMGPVMPDDFSIAPWSSNAYRADPGNSSHLRADGDSDYSCEQFDFLRFAHRTEVEPRPTLGENGQNVEWKARCLKWEDAGSGAPGSAGQNNGEGAGIWIRHLDPNTDDEFIAYVPSSRRVRRMGVGLAFPNEQCRGCHQPYWAYALPKTEHYGYRLLGTTTILACMRATDEPAGIAQGEAGYKLTEEPFELRHAYIVEMTPLGGNPAMRTVIFVDSEIYVWLAAEFYLGGERTATAMPLWRMHPSPEGGSLFDLAGSYYFPTSGSILLRSLVPAHREFSQKINTGELSAGAFMPQAIQR